LAMFDASDEFTDFIPHASLDRRRESQNRL
jgi:hypothetical protein